MTGVRIEGGVETRERQGAVILPLYAPTPPTPNCCEPASKAFQFAAFTVKKIRLYTEAFMIITLKNSIKLICFAKISREFLNSQ